MSSGNTTVYRKQFERHADEVLRILIHQGAPAIYVFDEIFLAFGDHDVSEWKPLLLRAIDEAIEKAVNPK